MVPGKAGTEGSWLVAKGWALGESQAQRIKDVRMAGLFLSGLAHINPIADRTNNSVMLGPPLCSLGLCRILDTNKLRVSRKSQERPAAEPLPV